MAKLSLRDSEEARREVTNEQRKTIRGMYSDLAEKTRERAEKLKDVDTESAIMKRRYLNDLARELDGGVEEINKKLSLSIPNDMKKVAQAVVNDNAGWATQAGLSMQGSMQHVARDVVESILNGTVYQEGWSLSKALWTDVKKKQKDINRIVAEGIAQNKSAYDIAKDLEKYVDPKARKDWAWSKVYPGTTKKIDYSAQRLARTLVSHAYQQSLIRSVKPNPFVTGIMWRSAHTSRTCKLCNDRDGTVYKKDELPMDHPNGICSFVAVIPNTMDEVADRIADWYHGKTDFELDAFASWLRAS